MVEVLLEFLEDENVNRSSGAFVTENPDSDPFVNDIMDDLLSYIPATSLTAHQLRHLQQDVADISTANSLSDAAHLQLQLQSTKDYVKYPFQAHLKNSTVFHFSNDMSKFSPVFLELLHSVYQGSAVDGASMHYRINLVKSNGNIHALEFTSQENYWSCMRCIILIYRKIEINDFRCNCKVGSGTDNNNNNRRSLYRSRPEAAEDCVCTIRGSVVAVHAINNPEQEIFSTDILELSATTLSADHAAIHPFVWQINCALIDEPTDEMLYLLSDAMFSLVPANAPTQVLCSSSVAKAGMVPASIEEAARGESKDGPLLILFSGSHLVQMLNTSNYYDSKLALKPFTSKQATSKAFTEPLSSAIVSLPLLSYTRVLRVVIKRAADLFYPSKDDSLPSPYCIAYLLDAEGKKMTKNSVEHRTVSAPATLDPVWDREIFFLADTAAATMHLKVRHHKSYFAKEEHIGQVDIPIDCFVEGVEAHLCLPLEPTYRMDGMASYGEIHVLCELVYMDPADVKSSKPNPVILHKKPLNAATLSVDVSIRNVDDLTSAWWPCRHFNGTYQGSVLCGHSLLLMQLEDDAKKTFQHCVEYREGFLCIPWWQIISAMHISEASLIITLTLRPADPELEAMHLDFLVGPTRAEEMETLMTTQRGMCGFRLQIQNLFFVTSHDGAHLAEKFLAESIAIFSSLESILVESQKLVKKNDKSVEDKKPPPDYHFTVEIHRRKCIKTLLYINMLRRKCCALINAGHLPQVFTLAAAGALVKVDLAQIDKQCPMSLQIDEVIARVEAIVSRGASTLRQVLLCSSGRIPVTRHNIIAAVISAYHDAATNTIAVYESPSAGEELKIGVIKFLLANNNMFMDQLRPVLMCLGFKCKSALTLVAESKFDQMTDWYSGSMVTSIKTWLTRNIEYANTSKVNLNLPWDYEMVGDLCITPLPEMFRIQLNVFFDLCSQLVLHRNDNSQRNLRNKQLLLLNEKIILAVGQAMELLAEEYRRALQSKHWTDGDESEAEGHIKFLEACANDGYRIQTVHSQPIGDIQTTTVAVGEAVILRIKVAFERTRQDSLKRLARLMYADLYEYFSSFEVQWSKANNSILVGTITLTLEDYFKDIVRGLEPPNFIILLNICAGIICSRYILFLKDRCTKKLPFSAEDIAKVADDVMKVKKCFKKWMARMVDVLGDAGSDMLADVDRTLKYLNDAYQLLTLTPVSKLKVLVTAILTAYPKDAHQVASRVLKLVTLRPDYDLEIINMVAMEEKKFYCAEVKSEEDMVDVAEKDLFVRVFYNVAAEMLLSPSKSGKTAGTAVAKQNTLKVIRSMAADIAGTSFRSRLEEKNADIERAVGLRRSISRASSDGDLIAILENLSPEDTCYIVIRSIKVKNLKSGSVLGLTNPYVTFSMSNVRVKTKVQWDKQSEASWDEVLCIKASRSRLSKMELRVEVIDKERIRRKRIVGDVNLKLAGIEMHSIESWFALTCLAYARRCQVYVSMSLSNEPVSN